MKVSNCSQSAGPVAGEVAFSYEAMALREGVYKLHGSTTDTRFVVVKNRQGKTAVLFYSSGNLEAVNDGWADHKFVRAEEQTVCFELRE